MIKSCTLIINQQQLFAAIFSINLLMSQRLNDILIERMAAIRIRLSPNDLVIHVSESADFEAHFAPV